MRARMTRPGRLFHHLQRLEDEAIFILREVSIKTELLVASNARFSGSYDPQPLESGAVAGIPQIARLSNAMERRMIKKSTEKQPVKSAAKRRR